MHRMLAQEDILPDALGSQSKHLFHGIEIQL
jgi:hypothetical protein